MLLVRCFLGGGVLVSDLRSRKYYIKGTDGMTKIKECPFCGGEAYLSEARNNYACLDTVCCTHCGARFHGNDVESAIRGWNKRYALPAKKPKTVLGNINFEELHKATIFATPKRLEQVFAD